MANWKKVVTAALFVGFFAVGAGTTKAQTPADYGLPSDTIMQTDVSYGADPLQKLDIYRTPGKQSGPVIVMVHGGAWAKGDKASHKVVDNKARHFLDQGYVFVSVNYRLHPAANPLEQAGDVAMALAFVQKQSAKRNIDPGNLILMGHSSGAHLVALLSADPSIVLKAGGGLWKKSVLLDSAALNVPERLQQGKTEIFDTVFGNDPAFLQATSPYHHLGKDTVPMMAICSSLRRISCPQAYDFSQQAKRVSGKELPVIEVPLSHEKINNDLGLDGTYTQAIDDFIRL